MTGKARIRRNLNMLRYLTSYTAGLTGQINRDSFRPTKSLRFQMPTTGSAVALLLMVFGVLLWANSLGQIDMQPMDDTGLISVLPVSVLLSLLIVNLSFCIAISQEELSLPILVLHLVVIVVMLFGITAIVQEVPRFAIGWKLAGIVDYVKATGTVDGRIDAFFNWPAFFIFMAYVTEITGFDSAVSFMGWAPVYFNLLYLIPLAMIFRSATTDLRLIFLGLWFFCLANWIGQDYLAPQAFNYFFFLVIVAIILTWMRGTAWPAQQVWTRARAMVPALDGLAAKVKPWLAGEELAVAPSTPVQRAAFIGIMVLIFAAMVASHQLTPFAMLAAIGALVLFNRCTVLTLPIILGVMVAMWVLYMAAPYVSGHIQHLASPVGSVGTNIDANLTGRFRGSPGHIFINYMRTGMSLAVWALAFVGGLRRLRNGYRDWGMMLVAVTPFPLLLLQAYGGELLLRIYLFSVPFMVFFGAALFFPSPALGKRVLSSLLLFVVSFVLLVSFLFTRYGNERMTYFTADEVASIQYLYDNAEPGSQFVALTGTLPWRFQDYQTYRYTTATKLARTQDVEGMIKLMADPKFPASYLILSRSQKASGELYIGWPPGLWEGYEQALLATGRFRLVYANEDSQVYTLVHE